MESFADLYRGIGFTVEVGDEEIILEREGSKFKAPIDDTWRSLIKAYSKAKQYSFDETRRILTSYKSIETALVKIDPSFTYRPEHEYSDQKGNVVKISTATAEFSLAYMGSGATPNPMKALKRRLLRRIETRKPNKDGYIRLHKFEDLIISPVTAKYIVPRKIAADQLQSRGLKAIKSSLFKLALSQGECWELRENMPTRDYVMPSIQDEHDGEIPKAIYNDDLVKFYKVARSSVFPNHEFLSYYHVLEYHYLRVSDEILHTSIKSLINSPSFNSSYNNLNKLIATLKKSDNSSDETEMLKAVLKKYIDEEELIEQIKALEKNAGRQIYTDTKRCIFGEHLFVKLEKGHALQNTAKIIKHIRNALVHSSDRYNREDCFMPFSESETTVVEYIPILRFLAEKIIFATSDGA